MGWTVNRWATESPDTLWLGRTSIYLKWICIELQKNGKNVFFLISLWVPLGMDRNIFPARWFQIIFGFKSFCTFSSLSEVISCRIFFVPYFVPCITGMLHLIMYEGFDRQRYVELRSWSNNNNNFHFAPEDTCNRYKVGKMMDEWMEGEETGQ